ncbi:cytochrome c family protein [Azospirillum sp. TSO35-2]|uniref:c-type cytochrome n=1 Tax=Azospirillum sp. TSO35-2 TaxID=716796 RepID=UPI000D61D2C5|nr:cytochrome c family protein [Azospirillum sp. TSO35-2]PWC35903.1 cytochrome C [Azospirillum sp. TSO35-2]
MTGFVAALGVAGVTLGLFMMAPGSAAAQDAEAGAKVFSQCKACHTIEAGGPNRVGPNLHGIVGRKAGSVDGFAYSDAMKNAGTSWDEASLDTYLTDPKAARPGNKMAFAGVKNEQARKDLIAFLKKNSE